MKFRRNKIKREHSIIKGALGWLEDLSKNREVTDIIPGVIDVTHSKEHGIAYQYETPTGCKLLLKSGGSIQEAFVVTSNPQAVQAWVTKIMEELNLFQAALDDSVIPPKKEGKEGKTIKEAIRQEKNRKEIPLQEKQILREKLLTGIREDYKLVEIDKGLRDSYVESLASMADIDNPKLEDSLAKPLKDALAHLQEELQSMPIKKRK